MSVTAHHAEWLTLVPHSGPFLSVEVLVEAFPDGLATVDTGTVTELRAAYGAWADPEGSDYRDAEVAELHEAFIMFVLREVLELDEEVLLRETGVLDGWTVDLDVHDVTLRPDAVVSWNDEVRMLVSWAPRGQAVDQPRAGDAWSASPRERMVEQLRETGCPLGLVTDGERWTLVSWREGEAPGFATWWASLWLDERITLRAFSSLLGEHRFFSVPEEDTLAGLLQRSAEDQSQVTTKLGNQTLEAVQILIQTLDRLDRDRGGELLGPVDEGDLYDAAVTVMMRLIFLFYAEENELLPVGEDLYLERYAASSLRAQLQEDADQYGEEVLETRSDAWPRLLSTWRAVFAGVEHADMRLAPYGGSLFDPDRYPFLEGRLPGSNWEEEAADPLPVDNRTVLHLLNALQTLEERGHRRKLSFLALDVEQIGHVYEGMLDHTADRAEGWVLGFSGISGADPEIPLADLEGLDEKEVLELLKDRTNRGASTNKRWLKEDPDEVVEKAFGLLWAPAFEGDEEAARRIKRWAKFLRKDSQGAPVVFPPGSAYVCDSSHRGATGTHYTPRVLTEGIIRETLEPLVYKGPAEGLPKEEWALRPPDELLGLNVADPACGSGAFLVQTCRYLAEKLVAARREHGELTADPTEEDLTHARREVAARCLYGVDKNPMAVEMAKLSLWLVTLAKDRPFSFVDHAIGLGDSLFGLTDLAQLRHWDLASEGEKHGLFTRQVENELERSIQIRQRVEAFPVVDHQDAELKAMLLAESHAATRRIRALADLLVGPYLTSDKPSEIERLRSHLLLEATSQLSDPESIDRLVEGIAGHTQPFHWPVEFPEVFEGGGFDAIVGNPPFLGNRLWRQRYGPVLPRLARVVVGQKVGKIDLSVVFHRRAATLLKDDGAYGLLATSNIADGDAVDVGLRKLLEVGTIYFAKSKFPWPGTASWHVALVCFTRRQWNGVRVVDGEEVREIGPRLRATTSTKAKPEQIQSAPFGFAGIHNARGLAFVISRDDPWFEMLNEEEGSLLKPYISGNDITTHSLTAPRRWALDIGERGLDEISERWPRASRFLDEVVQPTRLPSTLTSYKGLADRWWQFWNPRMRQLGHVRREDRVIVMSKNCKYVMPLLAPSDWIYTNQVVVIDAAERDSFAIVASSFFRHWVRWFSDAGLGERLRISISRAVSTFPLPRRSLGDAAVQAGERLQQLIEEAAEERGVGITDFLNELHGRRSPAEGEILDCLKLIDRALREAYDWSDMALEHGFQGVRDDRFDIGRSARMELLDRLRRLNLRRYQEEVEEGLHGEKARRDLAKKRNAGERRASRFAGTRRTRTSGGPSGSSDPRQSDMFGPKAGT